MQRLSLAPEYNLLNVDFIRRIHLLLALLFFLLLLLVLCSTHMVASQLEQIRRRGNAPVNSLHDFSHWKRGKVSVHALFEFLAVVWDGAVDAREGETEFGEGAEARWEAVYKGG